MTVRMELSRVLIRENKVQHIIELREVEGERVLPIVIGLNEAMSIERRLLGEPPIRPYTHELIDMILDGLGAKVQSVLIRDLQDGIFFARLLLRTEEGKVLDLDARPSDALALAVTTEATIEVDERVLEEVMRAEEEGEGDDMMPEQGL